MDGSRNEGIVDLNDSYRLSKTVRGMRLCEMA